MKRKTFLWYCVFAVFSLFPIMSNAANNHASTATPQPTACIVSSFTNHGNDWWNDVALKLTNQCGKSVDFQNSTITFNDSVNLNTSFWGAFGSVAYPDNNLQITSQPSKNGYIASLSLHFPEQSWSNTTLQNGQSITLQYGVASTHFDENSVKVYLNGQQQPVEVGQIDITNSTAKPSGVTQDPWVGIKSETTQQIVNRVQISWGGSKKQITGLAPDTYALQPENITDTQGTTYQGAVIPRTVTLKADQTVNAAISYTKEVQNGKIKLQVQPLPQALAGYSDTPNVVLTRKDTGGTVTKSAPWNTVSLVDQLANNAGYIFATSIINFNSFKCTPSFNPAELNSNEAAPETTQLSYTCVQIKQDNVNLDISGLTASTPSVEVTLTPNDGTSKVTKTVNLTDGKGSDTVRLTDGVVFNVAATPTNGYSVSFNPQPLTAAHNALQKISYQKAATQGSRIIGYLAGWGDASKLPTADALKSAGYTHILVAFGLFSTTHPGQIVADIPAISKQYVTSLHNAGIKVIISLGGALSNVAGATVNFHEVIAKAQSPEKFQSDFVASLKKLMSDYGFDGFDVDIEHGFAGSGSFAKPSPTSDIGVMAKIIKQIYAEVPGVLITMAPQTANVAATSGYDGMWGNYAALIMQTYNELTWVGIQLYNTGCTFGINQVCYVNKGASDPTYSVAMATGLLENWPAQVNGQPTGFQPYISHLRPDQVVLGYLSQNGSGVGDGSPVTNATGIKKAIQCLRTGNDSCTPTGPNGFTPPRAYPAIGGVFNWEVVNFDQSNHFKFAKDLKACVIEGNCN